MYKLDSTPDKNEYYYPNSKQKVSEIVGKKIAVVDHAGNNHIFHGQEFQAHVNNFGSLEIKQEETTLVARFSAPFAFTVNEGYIL